MIPTIRAICVNALSMSLLFTFYYIRCPLRTRTILHIV